MVFQGDSQPSGSGNRGYTMEQGGCEAIDFFAGGLTILVVFSLYFSTPPHSTE